MFKVAFFLWRKPGVSQEFYRSYYESRHAPFGASLGPTMPDCRRNFPEWTDGPPSEALSFDSMTQIWHFSREDFAHQVAVMTRSPARELIIEDEDQFLTRERQLFLSLDEFGSPPADPAAVRAEMENPPVAKILRFVKSAAGLSMESFRRRYENEIAELAAKAAPNLRGYRRSYVRLDDEYSFSGGVQNVLPIDPSATVFDMIEEFWLSHEVEEEVVDHINRASLAAGLIDPQGTVRCRVRECRSPGGQPAAPFVPTVAEIAQA